MKMWGGSSEPATRNAQLGTYFLCTQAVLLGSYATGRYDDWSDIDLALVSDAFEGERFGDRNKIRRITLAISSHLDPLPYRPEDVTPDDPFVKKVLETGVRVV